MFVNVKNSSSHPQSANSKPTVEDLSADSRPTITQLWAQFFSQKDGKLNFLFMYSNMKCNLNSGISRLYSISKIADEKLSKTNMFDDRDSKPEKTESPLNFLCK